MKKEYTLSKDGSRLCLDKHTIIMGIINHTPDSFSDGGQFSSASHAAGQALEMVDEGAKIIDIGGESARPGSMPIPVDEELERVIPVIEFIRKSSSVWISIDTKKAQVAEEAIKAGAHIINDISGLRSDEKMPEIACKYNTPVVVMHMLGEPETMQNNPVYDNVLKDIYEYFVERINALTSVGIKKDKIILDPGIGFGKTVQHNLEIINKLDFFMNLGFPLLIGVSRKSFIGSILDLPPDERFEGTAAAVTVSIVRGVHIIRVHDIKEMARVVRIADAIMHGADFMC